ncbi:uncharacterized protein LOC126188401 [Schistocerca cancellata]|uniref:uncharacterized protein LOC126188401 n=1 Tax=Schistocerca cancellata TaxID=274614 RepID=UPI002117DF8F|nr:uncharacterized protein LOC126188401 [Schistocerca cancellata]
MNGGRVLRLAAWQARAYLRQLCAAVCYLQARAIVHKDIKPANLLLAPDGRLTLADFGVAEALPLFSQGDTCTRSEGSPAFQPPEVANCEPSFSGFKLDVWSCGVTLYCMLLGVHPFLEGCTSVYQLQTRIAHYQVTFPSSLEAVSEEVLRGLMARLPAERWSADRLSQHAWLVRAAPPPPLPLRGRVGAALALRAAVPTFDYRRGPCRTRVARRPARPGPRLLSSRCAEATSEDSQGQKERDAASTEDSGGHGDGDADREGDADSDVTSASADSQPDVMSATAASVGVGVGVGVAVGPKASAGPAPAPATTACLYSYLQQPSHHHSQVAPAPPVRDASSLKGVRVGAGHEKFPSWPGSAERDQPQGVRPAPGGGSHRSKSWTDHTNYPKEKAVPYSRPYMKRPSPAFTQQLKTVMERCEKIPPETFLPRVERDRDREPDCDYNAPSPPERDKPQLTQAELDHYARSYQDAADHQFPQVAQPQVQVQLQLAVSEKALTQRDLEEYARAYGDAQAAGAGAGYAQSEGYHSYVSSSDSSTNTPFLDRLRRDSAAHPQAAPWDEPPERDSGSSAGGGSGSRSGRCDSVVTTSSGSASSSETLKWHGSLSDVSVASSAVASSSAPPPPQPPAGPGRHRQLIVAHSARVQTPQRHHSESVLYLGNGNADSHKLRLFPVSTYTVQPGDQQTPPPGSPQQPPSPPHRSASLSSPTQASLSVAERISELERQQQQQLQQQTKYTYLDPEKRHRVSDPTLKAIQKKALLSFYERHHAQPAAAARSQAWRSEPQLALVPPSAQQLPPTPSGPHSPPPPQPPPRPRTASMQSSRRASSASDYAGGSWREMAATREIIINEAGNLKDGPRHQHSSSCGSLSTDLLGPLIMGPSISVDDWVPERPPKKPHLRSAFPRPVQDRLPSPDLPPPSPPPMVEDEVFACDDPLPPPPADLPPVEGSPLPSSSRPQDQAPGDSVSEYHEPSAENEQVRIPERPSKAQISSSGKMCNDKQVEGGHVHLTCSSSCQRHHTDNSSAHVISAEAYNSSEHLKQGDGAVNNRNCTSFAVSQKHSENNTGNHTYLQNGHSSEKYHGHFSQRLSDNYNFRSRFHDSYRSQRYSEHPQRQQGSTSSLPRYAESHWASQRHSETNLPQKCSDMSPTSHRNIENDFQNYRNSDIIHRYSEMGYIPHRYNGDGNTTLPRNHEYRYFSSKNPGTAMQDNMYSESHVQRPLHNRYTSQRSNDRCHKHGTLPNHEFPASSEHTVHKAAEICDRISAENTMINHKVDNSANVNTECNCSVQKLNDCAVNQRKVVNLNSSHEKPDDSGLLKINSRLSPRKLDQETVHHKHLRSSSTGNKSVEGDSLLQKVSNSRLLKSSENLSSQQKTSHSSLSLHSSGGDTVCPISRMQENNMVHQHQSDTNKQMQGHFEREYHEHNNPRNAETKHLTSSRSFDNGFQQRHRQDVTNMPQKSFDSSDLTQRFSEGSTQHHKYPTTKNVVPFSQHSSTSSTPIYRNSSRMYTRPQPLKPFEITCQSELERTSSSSGQITNTDGRSSARCSTQKLVVNGKLAAPLHSDRLESERISGTVSMPAKARLQRLPLTLPVGNSQESASTQSTASHGTQEREALSPSSPKPAGNGRFSPPHQTSTSKASYLAYRRERAERCLPALEGSYKRTMSPPGAEDGLHPGHAPPPPPPAAAEERLASPECERLAVPERAAVEENEQREDRQEAALPSPLNHGKSSSVPSSVPPTVTDDGTPLDTGPPPDSLELKNLYGSREFRAEDEEDCKSHIDSEQSYRLGEEIERSEQGSEARWEDSATESTRGETESQHSQQSVGPVVTEQLQLVQRSEVVLRVNAATSDAASQTELDEPPSPVRTQSQSHLETSPQQQQQQQQQQEPQQQQAPQQGWPPARRKLQEEIDCEELSLDLASKLPPTDKLQGILVPDPDHKKPTDYVSDLFRIDVTLRPRGPLRSHSSQSNSSCSSTTGASSCASNASPPPSPSTNQQSEANSRDSNSNPVSPLPATSAYFTTSESKAKFLTQYGRDMSQLNGLNDNKELHQKKEELMLRLDRKLEVLRGEHLVVREESRVNDELGESVAAQVSRLARPHEAAKYRLHVEEVGKITSLLLALSGRLARAENALMGLPDNHADRKILESKRDKLIEQLEEAKKLKESIDRRSVSVANILNKYFNPEEYADYDHFINMKAKLIMDSKEIADKIKLGEEQLAALRETLSTPE